MKSESRRALMRGAKRTGKLALYGTGAVIAIIAFMYAAAEDKFISFVRSAQRRAKALLKDAQRHIRYMSRTFERRP